MKVSCAAYSFRQLLQSGEMSLEDFIRKGYEMGLDGVELTAYYFPTTEEDYLKGLKRVALAYGLDIAGTAIGGWRVIRTLGIRVTALEPVHGFAANASASIVIEIASLLGIPVSTTHIASSAIMGIGATKRLSAVRWGVAGNIIAAWLLTFPICGGLGYLFAWLMKVIF